MNRCNTRSQTQMRKHRQLDKRDTQTRSHFCSWETRIQKHATHNVVKLITMACASYLFACFWKMCLVEENMFRSCPSLVFFVVSAINLDPYPASAVAGTDTRVQSALSTTSKTFMPTLKDSNCMATSINQIQAAGFIDSGVGFQQTSLDSPPATLDYLGIIATNDFFVQVEGTNNPAAKGVNGKLYGYRARADASIYAALVQSEVLSA